MTKLRLRAATSLAVVTFSLGMFALGAATLGPLPAAAQVTTKKTPLSEQTGLDSTADQAQLATQTSKSLPLVVGGVVKASMAALGVAFVCLVIYAGFLYTLSAGNADAHKKAKGIIVNAVIGLVIVIGSYSLASYIVNVIAETDAGAAGGGTTTVTE